MQRPTVVPPHVRRAAACARPSRAWILIAVPLGPRAVGVVALWLVARAASCAPVARQDCLGVTTISPFGKEHPEALEKMDLSLQREYWVVYFQFLPYITVRGNKPENHRLQPSHRQEEQRAEAHGIIKYIVIDVIIISVIESNISIIISELSTIIRRENILCNI